MSNHAGSSNDAKSSNRKAINGERFGNNAVNHNEDITLVDPEINGHSMEEGSTLRQLDYLPKHDFEHYDESLLRGDRQKPRRSGIFSKHESTTSKPSVVTEQDDENNNCCDRLSFSCGSMWIALRRTRIGRRFEDFLFLTLLGISVSIFSFIIDLIINRCHTARMWMFHASDFSVAMQYFLWVGFYIVFTCFAVGITHIISPTAVGSGIPEMKTMIRGVVMPEYLTFRTLVAKVIGLSASLGSGLPVGKEGPFVHIAGVSAAIIEKILASFRDVFENHQTRRMADILAPACAVGVACTFAAPVGGLLFSIEATATYFAVRNYWRGFYAAACGTIVFRIFAIWLHEEETLTAMERTYLPQEVPFHPTEMIAFMVLGLVSGLGAALFININKYTVIFLRTHKTVKAVLLKNRFIYPTIVALVMGTLMFPGGLGKYSAGYLTNLEALEELFSNATWIKDDPQTIIEAHELHTWAGPLHNVLLTLTLFTILRLVICAISTTCAFPCGMIIPAFTIGAGLGRLFGETMAWWFPLGFSDGNLIIPGGYAIIGSAAYAAGVTQTFSTVVIIFELTGQIGHILPCVIAVMIANIVSRSLTPSVYDSIILIKKLPYLPASINAEKLNSHQVYAEDVMKKDLCYLSLTSTYGDAQTALEEHTCKAFPIVNNNVEMLLIGSVQRSELSRLIYDCLSLDSYLLFISKRANHETETNNAQHCDPIPSSRTPTFRRCSFRGSTETLDSRIAVRPRRESVITAGRESVVSRRVSVASRRDSVLLFTGNGVERVTSNGRFVVHPVRSISQTENSLFPSMIPESDKSSSVDVKMKSSCQKSSTINLHEPNEPRKFENYQMAREIDFSDCRVDESPFQIVAKTSLHKLHALFSLLNLHHAYVTNAGRLAGVISLNELRTAINNHVAPMTNPTTLRSLHSCFCGETEATHNDNAKRDN